MRWAAQDHGGLLEAAVAVAAADGRDRTRQLLEAPPPGGSGPLLGWLVAGTVDADCPLSRGYVLHLYHFHHPWSHRGYLGVRRSAAEVVGRLWERALELWRRGRQAEAAYQLGRACHLVADAWVPHHAAGVSGCGHGAYEGWLAVSERWRSFAPQAGGYYSWLRVFRPEGGGRPHLANHRRPGDWVELGAHTSFPWFARALDGCRRPGFREAFPEAAAELVPGTVRCLAGFLDRFFGQV
ncbi:MAG: zinc dependent phospholipase C family protein [Firmicutes bacterium]|nr:zinc dependent phospholipase C family protein [Bacillota bacterium]